MITKERLKELIEQGATIYSVCYGEVFEEKLTSNHFVGVADDEISLMQRYNGYEKDLVDYIRCLYETEEEANWVAEFGCIERTERLELPTWEEFIEMEEVCFWKKNHRQTVIRILGTKYIAVETSYERFFTGDLTKENYTLACRKAKELFLGEKK